MKRFSVPVAAGIQAHSPRGQCADGAGGHHGRRPTYENLKLVQVTGRFGQAGRGADSYIPMYGEHAPSEAYGRGRACRRPLRRPYRLSGMLARVDIINSTTSGAGTIAEEVYFVNSVGNGRVWVDLATYNTGAAQSGYMSPTLPTVLQPAVSGGHALEGMAGTGSPLITYYLNEQPATSGAVPASCCRLTIRENGTTTASIILGDGVGAAEARSP